MQFLVECIMGSIHVKLFFNLDQWFSRRCLKIFSILALVAILFDRV